MPFPDITYRPLPLALVEHALARPSHIAIVDGDDAVSYADLRDRVSRAAGRLAAAGVGRGDRVVVALPRKLDLMIGTLAAMALGATVLPLSLTEEALEPVVAYFEPKAIVFATTLPPQAAGSHALVPFGELPQGDPREPAHVAPDDIGLVILTSGTTQGQRRGALLSHRALSGSAQYMNERMGIDASVCDLVTAPLEHGFGMGRARCALHVGGTVVLQSGLFSPRAVVDELGRRNCNMISAAVSAIVLLLENEAAALRAHADQMRWLEMGTGHLKPLHRRMLAECLPKTRCFMSYGLTEAIRCTFLELNTDVGKIDTVGKPTSYVRVRVVDDGGLAVPPGVEGRIQVDGVNKASGYYAFPAAWEAKQQGAWLDTGDRGAFDQDGFLTFVGRGDDMINVGGLKVAPEELEAELMPIMAGTTFAVARIPDPDGVEGFVPGLFVETAGEPPVGLDQVRSHLRRSLPEFKIPRAIFAVAKFPRTPTTQKIRRAALSEIAAKRALAQIPRTTELTNRLRVLDRQRWPAFVGERTWSRRQVAQCAAGGTQANGLGWLAKAAGADDVELGALVANAASLFSVDEGAVVATCLELHDAQIVHALWLHAFASGGVVLELPKRESSTIARDLGLVRRNRVRHVVLDHARLARFAAAERHLWDTFEYQEFRELCVLDDDLDPALVAQFEDNFGFAPRRLQRRQGAWTLRVPDRPRDQSLDAEQLWTLVRGTAARVFELEEASLERHASQETTPGWNSLGFMKLVAAVEEAAGARLSPREIMAARQLGDLVKALSKANA